MVLWLLCTRLGCVQQRARRQISFSKEPEACTAVLDHRPAASFSDLIRPDDSNVSFDMMCEFGRQIYVIKKGSEQQSRQAGRRCKLPSFNASHAAPCSISASTGSCALGPSSAKQVRDSGLAPNAMRYTVKGRHVGSNDHISRTPTVFNVLLICIA